MLKLSKCHLLIPHPQALQCGVGSMENGTAIPRVPTPAESGLGLDVVPGYSHAW